MKIEDYGIIGDMHTVGLVGLNGSIDWLCVPRFGSDACFAALLGEEGNGHWKICPKESVLQTRRAYQGNTLILATEFTTESGIARLIDFMPVGGKNREVIRIVEGVAGAVVMNMHLVIRFDYGRTVPWVRHLEEGGLIAIAGPNALMLRTAVPLQGEELSTVARFSVAAGERMAFVLTWYPSHEEAPGPIKVEPALDGTRRYWEDWAARCKYRGPWHAAVLRSLLTLKALTYAPTGGIVAAATTSLPEFIGGVRNWDYRFCWLRDATFTLYSFMTAGYTEEARAWSDWLLRAAAGDPAQLQIMYGLAGERTLPEFELGHLRGYENSRPVRIGNAASEQFQLDVYGEIMDAMHAARASGIKTDQQSWHLQRHIIDFVMAHWRDPDEGIWEIRGPRRHFTHSKMMAWVAMDRAVKAVEQFGLTGDVEAWSAVRAEIHDDICRQGFHTGRRAFTQYYGSVELDASLLMMPLVGFLPVLDPRIISTVEQIERELTADGFVLRYRTSASGHVDGLPAGEGAFLPCSFWLADCLYLMGRSAEAAALFERLLAVRNDLGLLAEEYDPKAARQVGNVPQAFSHVGLVNTAHNLSPKTLAPAEERSAV
ncbi:MAG TPA: glycoside hydrolase family 15 protein [Opitutaceae bacterium]|nr:glycoside hydrolase family 15 protein [Opitutaceae bacterium]